MGLVSNNHKPHKGVWLATRVGWYVHMIMSGIGWQIQFIQEWCMNASSAIWGWLSEAVRCLTVKQPHRRLFSLTKPLNQCLIWCIYHIFNVAGTSSFHAWLVVSYEWQRQTTGVQWYQHQSVGMLIVKITMVLVFPSAHSFGSKITRLAHFRFRTLTMQMCCWIVDLNYITLNYIIVTL